MLSTEMLTILGGSAVLPYIAEALWCWISGKRMPTKGADTPRNG